MPTFNQRVWELTSTIPKGKVTTYKAIATALGCEAYRAVGNALHKNPYPSHEVPCHRVVNNDGRIGGFAHDISRKIKLLAEEGVIVKDGRIVDFQDKVAPV